MLFRSALQILQKLFLRSPEETGTENNGLRLAVFNDHMTTINQWHEIVKVAQDYGYDEVRYIFSPCVLCGMYPTVLLGTLTALASFSVGLIANVRSNFQIYRLVAHTQVFV